MSSKIPVAISFTGVANVLGVVGIIGSLVFVGLELRQSQRIALVDQFQERAYAATASLDVLTQADLDWLEVLGQFDTEPPLTRKEKAERNAINSAWFFSEADYFQYSQSLMTEDVWQAKLRGMARNLKGCKYPEIYPIRANLVEDAYKNLLDALPSQCND